MEGLLPLSNTHDSEGLVENIERTRPVMEGTEIMTDLEMKQDIAEYLESVAELRYDKWTSLSLTERKEVLASVEKHVATIEHRPPLSVAVEQLKQNALGYHDTMRHKIAINEKCVLSNDPCMHREVIETIIHEGRHAYQHYNVDVKSIHESGQAVKSWDENFSDARYGYYQQQGQKINIPLHGRTIDADWRLYYYQPVEIDARDFAGDVMARLEKKGVVGSARIA